MVAKVWQICLGKLGCIPAETDAETQLFPEKYLPLFPIAKYLELAGSGPNKPHTLLTGFWGVGVFFSFRKTKLSMLK